MVRKTLWGGYFALLSAALIVTCRSYPIPEFQSKLIALLCALFLVYSFMGVGHGVELFFRLHRSISLVSSSFLKYGIRFGLGFSFLTILISVTGWFLPGRLNGILTVIFLSLGLVAIWFLNTRETQKDLSALIFPELNVKDFFLLAPPVLGLGLSFLSCFSPITYYDSLVYHLALPKYYLTTNAITAVPFNLYSFFPQAMEMLNLAILGKMIEPEYVINLTNWFFSLATSLLLMEWANEISGKRAALLVFLLWWTFPAVLLLSLGAYVEIPLAFFTLLAIRCFTLWKRNRGGTAWLILSGFFSGTCFSIKYTGAITVLILCCVLAFDLRLDIKKYSKFILIFLASFLLPSAMWLTKNYLTIGNPVFPFFYRQLGFGNVGWTADSASSYFQMLTEYGAKSELFFELLAAPWKIIHSNLSFGGGFDVLGDFGWFAIIFSFPLFILLPKRKGALKFLLFYAAAHFVFWFTTKPVLRFLLANAPLMVLISSVLLDQAIGTYKKRGRIIFTGFMAGVLMLNFFIYLTIQHELGSWVVANGQMDRDEFLRKRLPYFLSFEKADQLNTKGQKILIIGEQRNYHLNSAFIASNLFAPSVIADICNNANTIDEIRAFLADQDIGLVLVNEGEIARLGGFSKFGFSESGVNRLLAYLNEKSILQADLNSIKIFSPM